MDADIESPEVSGTAVQLARMVLPWVALAVLLAVLWTIGNDFRRAQGAASVVPRGSVVASSTVATSTASAPATGTVWAAKVQSDVPLRSRADSASEIVATARQGSSLTVLTSEALWMRVKDSAGHIGWIPNDKKYITLQAK